MTIATCAPGQHRRLMLSREMVFCHEQIQTPARRELGRIVTRRYLTVYLVARWVSALVVDLERVPVRRFVRPVPSSATILTRTGAIRPDMTIDGRLECSRHQDRKPAATCALSIKQALGHIERSRCAEFISPRTIRPATVTVRTHQVGHSPSMREPIAQMCQKPRVPRSISDQWI